MNAQEFLSYFLKQVEPLTKSVKVNDLDVDALIFTKHDTWIKVYVLDKEPEAKWVGEIYLQNTQKEIATLMLFRAEPYIPGFKVQDTGIRHAQRRNSDRVYLWWGSGQVQPMHIFDDGRTQCGDSVNLLKFSIVVSPEGMMGGYFKEGMFWTEVPKEEKYHAGQSYSDFLRNFKTNEEAERQSYDFFKQWAEQQAEAKRQAEARRKAQWEREQEDQRRRQEQYRQYGGQSQSGDPFNDFFRNWTNQQRRAGGEGQRQAPPASRAKDWYQVLGVSSNASQQEVKQAFKTMMRKYHPDMHPTADAAAKAYNLKMAQEVGEAMLEINRQRGW
jgi:DnaJ-domain-containing protein 1